MTRLFIKARALLAGGIYLFAVQPSFAQAMGHSSNISLRGVIVFLVLVAGAYWLAGYYFKNRQSNAGAEGGFLLPPAAWFVVAAITAALANVFLTMFMTSINPANDLFAGTVAILYFLVGWVLPGTVVACVQMMQRTPPESLSEAHGNILIPTLGGYYLTMLWTNDIGRVLGISA